MPLGITAKRSGDAIELTLSDGTAEERLRVDALELAEALARLEAPGYPTMDPEELEDEPDDVPNYTTATARLIEPEGLLTLRKVRVPGPDLLEFTTPAGSVYEFEWRAALDYLRPLLPR
ncbi:MAG TPA: TFIIB-type zinc ribbon-containing protein [Oceanithermus profundus]|uniref:TFIIB-type zinc ribbon-containing protein n=1 Tax=Oceanithermus profundus TaxID=187137 RepID=A0A7C4V4F8_9DEIN|nr:TFIIB-type zinc ribbon-containing protein [Oceanithermus profundus]